MNYPLHEIKNMVSVTHQLLDQLKIKVNVSSITAKISSHPQFPGLIAIQDCLADFNIIANSYSINKELYNLSQLQYPFIANLSNYYDSLVLVHNISNGYISISNKKNKTVLVSEDDFLANWDGILLFALPDENSGEVDFYKNQIKNILEQALLPAFCIVLTYAIILVYAQNSIQWPSVLLFTLKFLGLSISMVLIIQTINPDHSLIDKLCVSFGKNGCSTILKSKFAKITPWLSWSELGYFYFSGSFLTLIFFPQFTLLLAYLNFLALPFTFYSFYRQYKLKNWCLLCCTIQGIILMEFLTFAYYKKTFNDEFIPNLFHLSEFSICFFLPMLGWALQKRLGIRSSLVKSMENQLKFKYNIDLFNFFLLNKRSISIDEGLELVHLGNPNSETIITIISNPFCKPCSQTHRILEDWLARRDNFYVQLIFLTNNDEESYSAKVAEHFMALNVSEDKSLVARALSDWFKQTEKKYETWAKIYPATITDNIKKTSVRQKQWCESNNIIHTPTILVNGYILEEPYQLDDLKYLIN